jgi:hypothetical protein
MTKSTIPAEKVRFFSGSSNPALAASIAAVIFIWSWRAFDGKVGATFTALREKPQTLHLLALGALVGPLLGVSASLLAGNMPKWAWPAPSWHIQKPYTFL